MKIHVVEILESQNERIKNMITVDLLPDNVGEWQNQWENLYSKHVHKNITEIPEDITPLLYYAWKCIHFSTLTIEMSTDIKDEKSLLFLAVSFDICYNMVQRLFTSSSYSFVPNEISTIINIPISVEKHKLSVMENHERNIAYSYAYDHYLREFDE